jgi:histidinol-phosphatase
MGSFRQYFKIHMKDDETPVTNVDLEVQSHLAAFLKKMRPEDAVLSEEDRNSENVSSNRQWIIDPLDHTLNYIRRIETFGTLIALEVDDEPIAAVVSAPALPRRWWATKGGGAHTSKGQIFVSNVEHWSGAYLTFAAIHLWDSRRQLQNIAHLAQTAKYTDGSGGFLGHMRVAEGQIDASLDPWGEPWDNAAVRHIIEEAGGRFTDVSGKRTIYGDCAVVTNGKLHDHVLGELNRDYVYAPHATSRERQTEVQRRSPPTLCS